MHSCGRIFKRKSKNYLYGTWGCAGNGLRSKMSNVKKAVYRNALLTLLGATRAISRVDVNPPTKWLAFLDGLRVSSDMLYVKLSSIDNEVEEEFIQREELIERRLGKKKFYSENELQELKEKQDQIQIQKPRF